MFSALLLFILTTQAQTTPANVIIKQTFEADENGWTTMGGGGSLRATKKPAEMHAGANSLAFDYEAGKKMSVMVLPTESALEGMTSMRFWLKTDVSTPVAVFLAERKPGGDYSTYFWSPKDKWQQIVLQPSDFTANDGAGDPVDPDGKLDLDAVQGIGLLDLKLMFGVMGANQQMPFPVDLLTGAHTLLISDFQIATSEPEPAPSGTGVTIDAFDRPFAQWMNLGGMDIAIRPGENPLQKPALEAVYKQTPGKMALLNRRLGSEDLSRCDRLAFDIASRSDAQIAVSVEMLKKAGKGSRYTYLIEVKGDSKKQTVTIPFTEFALDENSPPDPAGKFDPTKIRSLSLLDVTGVTATEAVPNTLWLADVRALYKN